jgi:hypothetical protein
MIAMRSLHIANSARTCDVRHTRALLITHPRGIPATAVFNPATPLGGFIWWSEPRKTDLRAGQEAGDFEFCARRCGRVRAALPL